jgi:hypothetical protein
MTLFHPDTRSSSGEIIGLEKSAQEGDTSGRDPVISRANSIVEIGIDMAMKNHLAPQ